MIIKNAKLYDPANGIEGEQSDIYISGDAVSDKENFAATGDDGEIVDATGLIAMPGALDIHSHLTAADEASRRFGFPPENFGSRAVAELYLSMGFTTIVEPGLRSGASFGNAPVRHLALQLARGSDDGLAPGFLTFKYVGSDGCEAFLSSDTVAHIPPPHIHLPDLGKGGSIQTLEKFLKRLGGRRCHLSHLAYYIFDSVKGKPVPRAKLAAEMISQYENVTFDLGPVSFGETFSLTADEELSRRIARTAKREIGRSDDFPYSTIKYNFRNDCYYDSIYWLAGMEFLLELKDISKASLSIDYPSGGHPSAYPFIIASLMEREKRERFASTLDGEALKNSTLMEVEKEFSIHEIASITRSSPARALLPEEAGSMNAAVIKRIGNLSAGSFADVALYSPSDDIQKMFAHPAVVVKGGSVANKV